MGIRLSASERVFGIVVIIILSLLGLSTLFPLVHILAVSFSDKAAASGGLVTVYPVHFTLVSYKAVMADSAFFHAFGVSVERVLLGGAIQFVLTIVSAYALSRPKSEFRSRDVYMWVLVFTMIFSGGLIPTYLTIKSLHMLDTMWSLVLPTAVAVFNIIVLMNFFKSLPKELDEAAVIDGSGPWHKLWAIYFPLSLPSIATVTLFSVVGHWNAFFDGLIYMNDPNHYPLQTYLNQIIVQAAQPTTNMTPDEIERLSKLSDRTMNAAKILVSMVPILVIYPFLQRYFITGITLGSVKE
ncbi:carbohydrate ABC transporter permease [Paenibacillus sacheonensis]|uniref:ABC transporter permease subunit n=1 Tax=Paenibacillus sacheonensis TaxID=742054 RepID=A0A7X4YJP8_9BACL|nr:carbohydrate ABC transporter permease [Paenibacillus sacheonensis]MBM7564019.1 multiple sugar transport system permease protein/putative aldouronate transport system permease protein [Paenibacillus sacheonensis]NBC67646.1 ABC transporter permease subunit [Paenibacillus sacheonensis]